MNSVQRCRTPFTPLLGCMCLETVGSFRPPYKAFFQGPFQGQQKPTEVSTTRSSFNRAGGGLLSQQRYTDHWYWLGTSKTICLPKSMSTVLGTAHLILLKELQKVRSQGVGLILKEPFLTQNLTNASLSGAQKMVWDTPKLDGLYATVVQKMWLSKQFSCTNRLTSSRRSQAISKFITSDFNVFHLHVTQW